MWRQHAHRFESNLAVASRCRHLTISYRVGQLLHGAELPHDQGDRRLWSSAAG
jgi:hypothetical protein